MPYHTNLANVLRGAGLKVVEVPGWQNRGHGAMGSVQGVMWHHTATSARAAGNYPSQNVVTNGRSDLPGPLANLGLGRDGTWYVIAAGLAYHAGNGTWAGQTNNGNSQYLGVEAEHPGVAGNPWPPAQIDSYRRGTAALLKAFGLPSSRMVFHKEYARPVGRKIDPYGLDPNAERQHVQNYMNNPINEEDDLKPEERQWLLDIHKFLYENGFIANRLDPANPTKGADMIPDMASWAFKAMVNSDAAKKAAESANFEVTYQHPTRVEGVDQNDPNVYKDTMLGYSVNADKYGYENQVRLDKLEAKVDKILKALEGGSKK